MLGTTKTIWGRLTRALHFPRRYHRWQMLLALAAFSLPLLLAPWVSRGGEPYWERLDDYPGNESVRQVLVAGGADGLRLYAVGTMSGIHVSMDAGETWYSVTQGLPRGSWGEISVLDLASVPGANEILFAIVNSLSTVPRPMLYWTINGGFDWQPRASLGKERLRTMAIGQREDRFYVATSNDLLKAFFFEQEGQVSPEELFERGEDNLHWLSLSSFQVSSLATFILLDEGGPGSSGALDTPRVYVGTEGLGLYVTLGDPDSGNTIRLFDGSHGAVLDLVIDPLDRRVLYLATELGVHKSIDAGVTWFPIGEALQDRAVRALLADPQLPDTLYAGVSGRGVYVSRDAGISWVPLGSRLGGTTVASLAFAGDKGRGTLYAATERGVWRLPLDGSSS